MAFLKGLKVSIDDDFQTEGETYIGLCTFPAARRVATLRARDRFRFSKVSFGTDRAGLLVRVSRGPARGQ